MTSSLNFNRALFRAYYGATSYDCERKRWKSKTLEREFHLRKRIYIGRRLLKAAFFHIRDIVTAKQSMSRYVVQQWRRPPKLGKLDELGSRHSASHPLGAADADKKFDLFKCNNDKCERSEREFRLGL